MSVYLLYASDYETDWVTGVYSTREKAEESRKLISKRYISFIVEEEVL